MFARILDRDLVWRLLAIAALAISVLSCPIALGSGPRWVTGPPYFNNSGAPVAWYANQLQYYTDPGALSASVDHAAADALVARAAAVWNIPTASLVLTQGGSLNQHVSSANIVTGNTGPAFPADVQSVNYQSKPIAVIYDTDGSVTDLLLGAGASDPLGCRQTGVTESVDSFSTNGQILHALLILNGRCSGPDPDQQTQLQYQLVRAFGRVLGLAWSQTNDNVFTGTPRPTTTQIANWPVMHPIDLLCGPYTFKCMSQPFTLRDDDLASLGALYPIYQGQATGAKQDTLGNAFVLDGAISLGSGQGMEGVNITVRRLHMFWAQAEDWQTVSGVSGYLFRRQAATPLSPLAGSAAESQGTYDGGLEGYFNLSGIQLFPTDEWETLYITTEPINPLYTGEFALGTYAGNTIAPSGDPVTLHTDLSGRYGWDREFLQPSNAAAQCTAGSDGTAGSPVPTPAEGWWSGMLCGYGHASWLSVPVRDGRSFTVEVTALDEHGSVTMNKAMPVLGAWHAADASAVAPTMGSAPAAFNSLVAGMTTLAVRSATADTLRFVIADERGAGRPDFFFQGRVLYADSIAPANVPTTGGSVTIRGMGFRPGMTVSVRGVAATVVSISSTQIVANVPSLRALGLTRSVLVDVVVADPSTGGSSVMTGALGYASSAERLQVTSIPSGTITVGVAAPTPIAVQVVGSDGVTPVAGQSVTFAVSGARAILSGCGAGSCTALTDFRGTASMTVTPQAAGALNLSVSTPSVALGPYRVVATDGVDVLRLVSSPAGVQTTSWPAGVNFAVKLTAADGVTPRAGQTISFSSSGSAVLFAACDGPLCSAVTDAAGVASTGVTPLVSGSAVLTASSGQQSGQQSISATVSSAPASIHLVSAPSGVVTVGIASATIFKVQVLAGDGTTPVGGEAVAFMAGGGAVAWSACGAATCTVLTDGNGFASSGMTATVAAAITLTAAAREGSVTANVTAAPEVLRALQIPSGTVPVGTAAASPFTVQLLQADGVTPVAGRPVLLSLLAGTARWSSCLALPCTVLSDATGTVSGSLTPLAAGPVTVLATAAGLMQSATITGTNLPNILEAVTFPAASLLQGDTAAQPFAVRVFTGDHTAGVAAQPVTFSADNGAVLTPCGTPTCTIMTDSTGLASISFTGLAAGTVHLSAASATGSFTATVTILARTRSLAALRPRVYVAEGTAFTWIPEVSATDSAASVNGLAIRWSGSAAVHFAGSTSSISGTTASMPASVAAVGVGVVAEGTACAWATTCASLSAVGVSAAEFQVVAVDDGGQSVISAGSFAPVHLRVVDGSGHPVAFALVTVHQTITAAEPSCAGQGRCGAAGVLGTSQQSLRSDIDGLIEIAPDTLADGASQTSITVLAGSQGVVTVTLQRQP